MSQSLTLHRDLEAFVRRDEEGKGRLELLVSGARCAGCINKIEKAVRELPGVDAARLNLTTGKLAVQLEGKQADPGTYTVSFKAADSNGTDLTVTAHATGKVSDVQLANGAVLVTVNGMQVSSGDLVRIG